MKAIYIVKLFGLFKKLSIWPSSHVYVSFGGIQVPALTPKAKKREYYLLLWTPITRCGWVT